MIKQLSCLKQLPKVDLFKKYDVVDIIYNSNVSSIYKVVDKTDKSKNFVIKELNKNWTPQSQAIQEFSIMKEIPKGIGPFPYRIVENNGIKPSYHILMECLEGRELFNFYEHFQNNNLNIPKDVIREIIFNSLLNINELNKENFVHLDLKMENMFVSPPTDDMVYPVKFIDFGGSNQIIKKSVCKVDSMNGTYLYTAPETLSKKISVSSDIWSLGVITHILLYHRFPYLNDIDKYNYENLTENDIFIHKSNDYNNLGNQFIKDTLVYDYRYRPTASQLLDHPWFREII